MGRGECLRVLWIVTDLIATQRGTRRLKRAARRYALTLLVLLSACQQQTPDQTAADADEAEPIASGPNPAVIAGHVVGVQVATRRGDSESAQQHMEGFNREFLRGARIPDARRSIDPEAARGAVRTVEGVRSAIWMDRSNLIVMVDGARYRNQRMINTVCRQLEPLGDTLAVVINLQDVTATTAKAAATLSRNCQLPAGERAVLQRKRDIDVVPAEVQEEFERQQKD